MDGLKTLPSPQWLYWLCPHCSRKPAWSAPKQASFKACPQGPVESFKGVPFAAPPVARSAVARSATRTALVRCASGQRLLGGLHAGPIPQ